MDKDVVLVTREQKKTRPIKKKNKVQLFKKRGIPKHEGGGDQDWERSKSRRGESVYKFGGRGKEYLRRGGDVRMTKKKNKMVWQC